MKAVILSAGVGSRIRPLTDTTHKSLLAIHDKTILERMISHILDAGITDIALVTGYKEDDIKEFVKNKFPQILPVYIHNKNYVSTNTAYSLALTEQFINGSAFVKFDADVVFEKAILTSLLSHSADNALCIDTHIRLAQEEVKVIVDDKNYAKAVGKHINPHEAYGESIGIEKIGKKTSPIFFEELKKLLSDEANHQRYYDDTYTTLVEKGHPFFALDISGKHWVEIDTNEDYAKAKDLFSEAVECKE